MRNRVLLAALVALLFAAGEAQAKCDPASGWPPGKPCRDADQVGLRVSGEDKSAQEAFDAGELGGAGIAGAPPQTATVATLPTCDAAAQGTRRTVTDAADASSCTTGGGASVNSCRCDAGGWVLEGTGGLGVFSSFTPFEDEAIAWPEIMEQVGDQVGVQIWDASAIGRGSESYYSATRSVAASATCDASNLNRIWVLTDSTADGSCTGGGMRAQACQCRLTGVTAGPAAVYSLVPVSQLPHALGAGLQFFVGQNVGFGDSLSIWQKLFLTTLNYSGFRGEPFAGNNDWPRNWDKYQISGTYNPGDCLQEQRVTGAPYHPISGHSMMAYFHLALGQDGVSPLTLEQTTAFVGWVSQDRTALVINNSGVTAADVIEDVELGEGFGVLWHNNVFYQVWQRGGNAANITAILDLTDNAARTTYFTAQRQLHVLMRAFWNAPQGSNLAERTTAVYAGFYPAEGPWNVVPPSGLAQPGAFGRLQPIRAICQDVSKGADRDPVFAVGQQWIRSVGVQNPL